MGGIDDHPRQPRRIEHPFFLVEVPASRLPREQPPLEPVGEPGDDVLQPRHLLVEIGAEPPQLLLVAQLAGLDDLVEAGGEGLVVGGWRQLPIAPPGRRQDVIAKLIAGRGFLFASLELLGLALRVGLIFDLLAPHFDVAAARRAVVTLVGRLVAARFLALGLVARFVGSVVGAVLRRRQAEILDQAA